MSKEDAYVLGRITGGDSGTLAYYMSVYAIVFNHGIAESMSSEECEWFWKVDLYSVCSARCSSEASAEFSEEWLPLSNDKKKEKAEIALPKS